MIALSCFNIPCYIITTLKLVNLKKAIKHYFLFDAILLITLASIISQIVLYMAFLTDNLLIFQIFSLIILCISTLAFTGNFKVMIKYCKWSLPQLIIMKLLIAMTTATYLGIGCKLFYENF